MGKYLVLYQIGGAGDKVIMRAGAVITVPGDMDELSAQLHAVAGNLRPVDGTPAPVVQAEAAVVHEAAPTTASGGHAPGDAKPGKASKAGGE